AAAPHLARPYVELEVRKAQYLVLAAAAPSQERADAREQLLERERLRHVVVRACVQPRDPVLDLVAGGEHQHRNAAAAQANPLAHLEPIEAGHEDVEHDRVRLRFPIEPLDRLAPVAGELGLIALELE